jgi:hypothetical protein
MQALIELSRASHVIGVSTITKGRAMKKGVRNRFLP